MTESAEIHTSEAQAGQSYASMFNAEMPNPSVKGTGCGQPLTSNVRRSNMTAAEHVVVAEFTNDTQSEMRIFLEMTCEEVFLAPGQHIELLARPSEHLLPLTIAYLSDGIQVFPHKEWDPDWMIRFEGKLIKPEYPTRLTGIMRASGPSSQRS
jgi:hypothetical protein